MFGNGDYDWTSFALGMLIGGMVALFLGWRRKRLNRSNLDKPPTPPPSLTPELRSQILKLRAEGRVIDAIKMVRERTGCDLKSAKEAVDKLR